MTIAPEENLKTYDIGRQAVSKAGKVRRITPSTNNEMRSEKLLLEETERMRIMVRQIERRIRQRELRAYYNRSEFNMVNFPFNLLHRPIRLVLLSLESVIERVVRAILRQRPFRR